MILHIENRFGVFTRAKLNKVEDGQVAREEDADTQKLEDIARLSDDVFKIEADVEKSGKVSDEQIKSAQRLTDMVYDVVKDMGLEKSEVSYMDLHMDAIKNPEKAGSMK